MTLSTFLGRMRGAASRGAAVGVAAATVLAVLPASAHSETGGAPPQKARPARAAQPGELVRETFRNATADPRFHAFGSACLTGAPRVGTFPGDQIHPLEGCAHVTGPGVPPGNAAPRGYLQLTDSGNDREGAVLFDSPIPSEDGLKVTFEQWQYGETSQVPADGIAFFLTDGAHELSNPGPFGGSLGYAQKWPDQEVGRPVLPGVGHGYMGVGLDVLGNFFGDWEWRGHNCGNQTSPSGTAFYVPAPGENMVTVRGPGDGIDGYCWLDATTNNKTTTRPWISTLPGNLQGPLRVIPPGTTPEQAEELLEPSRRTVQIEITPAPDPKVHVDIDFHTGNGFQRVLDFDAPSPVPSSYRFGFAASTGLFNDVHLIRNLVVETQRPVPPPPPPPHHRPELALSKDAEPFAVRPGERIKYKITARNVGRGDFTEHEPAHLRDDLRDVLRFARFNRDLRISSGKVLIHDGVLEWHGPIRSGGKVTIRFSVTVKHWVKGGTRIRNRVTSPLQPHCGDECKTVTRVLPRGHMK